VKDATEDEKLEELEEKEEPAAQVDAPSPTFNETFDEVAPETLEVLAGSILALEAEAPTDAFLVNDTETVVVQAHDAQTEGEQKMEATVAGLAPEETNPQSKNYFGSKKRAYSEITKAVDGEQKEAPITSKTSTKRLRLNDGSKGSKANAVDSPEVIQPTEEAHQPVTEEAEAIQEE
jgi:hypothetical protein